jgi:putative membrane protein
MLQQLQSASGAQFDRLYMRMQVKGHQEALKVQEGYSRRGDNDQLKTFASDASSMVQDHLSQAQQVLRGVSSRRGAQRGAGTTMQ